MKKIFLFILMVLFTIVVAPNEKKVEASNGQTIDIYLIAGQSNAAGYTKVDATDKSDLLDYDARYETGFDNVLYYGCTDVNVSDPLPSMSIQSTKIGLGKSAEHIGPELGMAEYFVIDKGISNKVGIIKYASGSSSIYDDYTSTNNKLRGNWYSPSVAKVISGGVVGDTNISGNCYRVFLDVVEQGLEAYKAAGYTPVIKGIAWMQGESEAQSKEYSAKYDVLLTALIKDMREGIAERAKKVGVLDSESNCDSLPVVVAKLPSKYETVYPTAAYTSVVREKQQLVADQDPFVTTIDNDDFALPGTDTHHYNCYDMLKLGNNFAKQFFDMSTFRIVNIKCSNGGSLGTDSTGQEIKHVVTSALTDTYISYTLVPARGYELTTESIKFKDENGNRVDVKTAMLGNFFQFQVPNMNITVEIEFKAIPTYNVSVSSKNGVVYRTNSERSPYRDEFVTFTFKPNPGYELDYITVNGETINADELNDAEQYLTYTVRVNSDLEVRANFKVAPVEEEVDNSNQTNNQDLKFFNANLVYGLCFGGGAFLLGVAGVVVLIVVKKKRNNK